MTPRSLAAASLLYVCSGTASMAATFTVNATQYDITTISGSFLDYQTLFESQVWYGDAQLALSFAETVRNSLGTPNANGLDGPYFAWGSDGSLVFNMAFDTFTTTGFTGENTQVSGATFEFAVASEISAIPLPAGGLLLLSGLGSVAVFRRTKQSVS